MDACAPLRYRSAPMSVLRLPSLPIGPALGPLGEALAAHGRVLLHAPPGAGKSTVVPLTLLDAAWLGRAKILMLEPRRIAARAVASRMAHLLGEEVGGHRGLSDAHRDAREPGHPHRGRHGGNPHADAPARLGARGHWLRHIRRVSRAQSQRRSGARPLYRKPGDAARGSEAPGDVGDSGLGAARGAAPRCARHRRRGPRTRGHDPVCGAAPRDPAGDPNRPGVTRRADPRRRRHSVLPAGRGRNPQGVSRPRRIGTKLLRSSHAALRRSIGCGAGRRAPPDTRRPEKDRPGDQHRRNQHHHRRDSRRRRHRTSALLGIRSRDRHEPARDGQGISGGGGSAPRPCRQAERRRLLPALVRGLAGLACRTYAARDPERGSGSSGARAQPLGRRRCRSASLARSAAACAPRAGARSAALPGGDR